MIGETISHYRIIERIGAGGMGVVYRAEDTRLGRTVALKFLPPEVVADRATKERFLREARAVSAIEHPNICTIHEVDETSDGRIFICMACYEGGTLKDRIEQGALPVGEAVRIAGLVARGLRAAHEAGIVHRDIKPGNIMLSRREGVRIGDFGLAKLAGISALTAEGSAPGTVAYMSPEQARGEEVDHRTDVWSLGVVLYEMLTGRRPFEGEYDQAAVYSILNSDPPPLSSLLDDVPPELERIVEKALEKDPAKRYQSAEDVLEDLRAESTQLEITETSGGRDWRFTSRRERVLVRVALPAVILAAALVGVWFLTRRGGDESVPSGRPLQVTADEGWEGDAEISPDGARIAYASNVSGNLDVHVTDVRGERVVPITDGPSSDHSPAWFPDGSALTFVSDRNGDVCVWEVGPLGGGATLLVEDAQFPSISPDGDRIAFSRPSDSGELRIWVAPIADPSSAVVLTSAEHGLWDHKRPAWSPDGEVLCYSSQHNLWIVPSEGGTPTPLTTGGRADDSPAWSSDGRHVYFDSEREGTLALWRVPSNGGEPIRMTVGSGLEFGPSISHDGSRLAYTTGGATRELCVFERDSGLAVTVPGVRGSPHPAIAPDASRILYASSLWGRTSELWERRLVDGAPSESHRRIVVQEGDASHPVYSPDGRWIAYYQIAEAQRDIWVVPSEGGTPVRFTEDPSPDIQPAWSPDGAMLAFVSGRAGTEDVWVADVRDGCRVGEPRRVTTGAVSAMSPVWSPEGDRICFVGVSPRGSEVWVVSIDGGGERRLTDGANAQRVRWDPLDGDILVSAVPEGSCREIWVASPENGSLSRLEPPVVFGSTGAWGLFDVSRDGSVIVFTKEVLEGDIWVLEADAGDY